MKDKLIVSVSPHVGSTLTTRKIMSYVIMALMIPLIAGVVLYGFYALLVVLLAVGTAVISEKLFNAVAHQKNTTNDLSAVVTGLILGLNLPPRIPLFVPIVGAIFAIVIVKLLFGGLGKNFANPAAAARVFLLLSWTSAMTVSFMGVSTYIEPLDYSNGFLSEFFSGFVSSEIVTGATPLASLKEAATSGVISGDFSILDLFLGRTSGSIGETSVLAILLAGAFLIAMKIIDWKIPTLYIVTCALCTVIFYENPWTMIIPNLFAGGLMFAAVFMLTDYSSSPNSVVGVCIYAVGAGFMTVLIRRFGGYNEGASLAILFMNILVPLIDKYTKPKPYGYKKPKKVKKEVQNA
ncbi:MAG: RnfABCDGE type electron transport complex subunit D [Bacillota bacterium]